MLGPNELPYYPVGDRCVILQNPPKEMTEGGLHIPDAAKRKYFQGRVIAAGLAALDKLYDAGVGVGDEFPFGRYSGCIEEWDHIIEGPHNLPDDSYDWSFLKATGGGGVHYKCSKTGAIRAIEPIIILNVDDVLASVELARRIDRGEIVIERCVTAEGKTQHVMVRKTKEGK